VNIGIIMGDFSQGSFETTTSAIDLAIGGQGFFKVQRIGTEEDFYTRAGNFHFDADGYMIDPHGYVLQGWKINNETGPTRAAGGAGPSTASASPVKGSGVPVNVRLDTWTVPPKQTTKTSIIANLSADGADASKNFPNPFTSLIQSWDGTQPPPNNRPAIAEESFAYTTSIKVYDESGLQHVLTVYYDKVDPNTYEGKPGETLWEYLVTMDPAEDKRQVWDLSLNNTSTTPTAGLTGGLVDLKTTKMAGVLMSGVMSFNAAGSVIDQTAYTLLGNITYSKDTNGMPLKDDNSVWADPSNPAKGLVPVVGGTYNAAADTSTGDGLANLTTWNEIASTLYPAPVSQTGYPMLVANFGGVPSANTAGSPKGDNYLMEFNLGLRVTDYTNPWTVPYTTSLMNATVAAVAPGTQLTANTYYTPDGLHGPKITYANPNYSPAFSQAYLAALAQDSGTPGTNVAALLGSWTPAPVAPVTFESMSWPFLPSTAAPADTPQLYPTTYFTATSADFAQLIDKTPATSTLGFINGTAQIDANSTKMLGTTYATMNGTSQNGYTFGNLTGFDVSKDGVLYGTYSNGVTLGLYQITLYDFTNRQGLYREGGNLYTQTMDSGEAFFAPAGSNGMGEIASYTLEQSNVDMAREFVQMISTQRGFQANSKVVTTVDTMLEVVVNMKR
jgi:flagellar hook protein FlgE